MPADALTSYLISGQFWAANFWALFAAMIYSMQTTGITKGKMKWQLKLMGWKKRTRFLGVFLVLSVVLNAAVGGAVAVATAL